MWVAVLVSLCLSFVLCGPVAAQPSPYGSAGGNVGTWTWGKSQSSKSDEEDARAPGETSWERLNAEHQAQVEQPPKETPIIQSLSPLRLWRWWRGDHEESNADQNHAPDDTQNPDQGEGQSDEQTAEPASE
jgi:hypothetical protein